MYVMHRIGGALLVSKTSKAKALKIEREWRDRTIGEYSLPESLTLADHDTARRIMREALSGKCVASPAAIRRMPIGQLVETVNAYCC